MIKTRKIEIVIKVSFFIFRIIISLWNETSSFYYSFENSFFSESMRQSFFLTLFLSPVVSIIAWSGLIVNLENKKVEISNITEVRNAKNNFTYLCKYLKHISIQYSKFIYQAITKVPLAILITILQKIKVFPLLIFGIAYFKYNTVITTSMMKNISEEIEKNQEKS